MCCYLGLDVATIGKKYKQKAKMGRKNLSMGKKIEYVV